MNSVRSRITDTIEHVFEGANLLPRLLTPSHTYTDSEPDISLERPISFMYEELPLRSTTEPSSKTFEGDIEDDTQFPSLSAAALHGPQEISSVDAKASQNA
jgi:hypothetical protein